MSNLKHVQKLKIKNKVVYERKKNGNENVDNHKQMRNSRQNDKLEQWVIHRAVENDVLGPILGCEMQKVFFLVYSLYYTA